MKIQLIYLGTGYTFYSGASLPYQRFRVLIDGQDISKRYSEKVLKEKLSYWRPRSGTMGMTCWGTSQQFEARISLGRFLGWDDSDWPEFARRVETEIEII